jgi:hypothetical protein
MKTDTPVVLDHATIMAALEANGSKQGGSKFVTGRVYTREDITAEMLVGVNLPPQARVCVRLVLEGAGTWSEEELHDHVQTYTAQFNTKQDAWKIFTYYRPKLIKAGFISMTK